MHRILICLDGSARAPKVLAMGIEQGKRFGARLSLFRAVGLPAVHDALPPEGGIAESLVHEARAYLVSMSQRVPPELFDGVDVAIGTPWDAICRRADAIEADLVVLGSHGYSGLDRLIGTTASKVVNHAQASVLVVRSDP